jgi:hypothetical protein
MSRPRNVSDRHRLADMSLPPEERGRRGRRGRRRRKRLGGTPPAQLDHGSGSKGRKRQREGEQKMRRWFR